jgi:hypothetical protein
MAKFVKLMVRFQFTLLRRFGPTLSHYQGFWPEGANTHVSFSNPHHARPGQSPRFPRPAAEDLSFHASRKLF